MDAPGRPLVVWDSGKLEQFLGLFHTLSDPLHGALGYGAEARKGEDTTKGV